MNHALPAVLLSALLASACASPPREQEIIRAAKDKVFPAVVFIKPIQEEYRGGRKEKVQVFGSGVIISADGYVVTNNHVAEKATEIRCILSDKEEIPAKVVGLDPETDLAVLKLNLAARIHGRPLPFASFGDSSKIVEGDLVMAMGAPHGLERSVSRGIISSVERYFDFAPYNTWFQTDAAINPGNSGGPLVDENGLVIGINARGMRGAENLGFAIPANVAREVVARLIKDGRVVRAWTGLRFQALRDFTRSSTLDATRGVLVAGVDEGSPAARAGLRAGDVVLSVNAREVMGIYEIDLPDVEVLFAELPIGTPAKVSAVRGGSPLAAEVTPREKGRQEGEDFECKKWDLTVKEITPFAEPFLYAQRNEGVYVQGLKYGGNAGQSGLDRYDILAAVDDREIRSLADLRAAYEASLALEKGKRRLLVRVLRLGYPRYVALEFEKDTEKIENE